MGNDIEKKRTFFIFFVSTFLSNDYSSSLKKKETKTTTRTENGYFRKHDYNDGNVRNDNIASGCVCVGGTNDIDYNMYDNYVKIDV